MKEDAVMMDLPTSIRGFVYTDADGEPVIVLNSRLTREQNRITYDHERRHIANGEIYDPGYIEYK